MERADFDVFLRSDFAHLGTYQQVGKALSKLQSKSKLLRIGKGIYGLARISRFSPGKIVPKGDGLPGLARQALTRLGYEVVMSRAERDRQEGRSTQVSTGRRLAIKGKQTKRKIGHDNVYVTYEHDK